jgi:hypothetical protein
MLSEVSMYLCTTMYCADEAQDVIRSRKAYQLRGIAKDPGRIGRYQACAPKGRDWTTKLQANYIQERLSIIQGREKNIISKI